MRRPHKKNAPLIKMAKPLLRIALSIFALATGISTAGAVDAVSLSATGQTSVAAGSYSDASAGITQLTGNGVGGFDKGEWVEYRLDALRTASYRFSLVMGSTSRDQSQGGAFEVFLNAQATASMSVSLGNAQGGSDAPAFLLRLFEGVNTIRLRAETPIADTLERLLVESAGIEGLAATLSPAKAERIEYGNPASFMCAVQSDGKPVSGSAVFAVDGKKSMPISLDAQGKAIFEASGLAAGKHTIAALYEGSAGTVQSNAVTFDIAKAVPVAPRTDSIGTHVAQYGQKLSDIKLKEGYRWENPSQMVGDASGEARLFTCLYNPDPANYFDCPFSIGIQVRKREVTLRAVNKEKTAGAGDPKLTIDVVNGSILPGDTIQGSLTYTGTRIGAYSIVEGEALFNENYDIEFVPGTIKINPTEKMKGFLDSIAALPSINTIADADKAVEIYRLYSAMQAWEIECLGESDIEKFQKMLVSAKAINQSSEAYSFKESSLPWSVRGEVREVKKQGGKYAELSPEFGKQGGILALVEVRLIDTLNGSVYAPPPNKPVSFTIKGLKVLSNGKIALAHEKPDGTVEYFSAEAKNGDVEFSLSGSALYAFAQDIESFSRVNIESIINTSRARLKWLPVFCLAAVASIYATSVKMENWPLWSEKKRLAAAQPKKAFSTPKYVFKYMRK